MMYGWGWGPGAWFGMGGWWIVLVVVLIAAAVSCAARRRGSRGADGARESARDVLDKRYARGEIGRDEYEQKKRDLSG